MYKFIISLGAIVTLVFAASPASAAPILPGTSALCAFEPDPVGGVAIAVMVTPMAASTFSATITSTVIVGDPANPFGGLTFVYDLTNSALSPESIGRVTFTGYSGFLTDMSCQPGPGVPASTMDRDATGDVVGFSFVSPPLGPTALMPGSTSFRLVVQTDAPAFAPATGNVIDGGVASGPTYAPVPEPASMMLILGGLSLLRRRR